MEIRARCFGKRFCTFCGRTNMHYYTWQENGETKCLGECFTRGCGNVDWCHDKTEAEVKEQYGDHMLPPDYDTIILR